MSQYSRLSIWESSPNCMSWYDHVVGRKKPAEPFITPNTEVSDMGNDVPSWAKDEVPNESGYQQAWFDELKAHDRKKEARRAKKELTASALIDPAVISPVVKTLPLDPYFEYMFADAELEVASDCCGNSVDDLSFGKQSEDDGYMADLEFERNDAPSPPESQPGTPEPEIPDLQVVGVAVFHEYEFSEADIPVTNQAFDNSHSVETDTRLEHDYFEVDGKKSGEDGLAEIGFFSGIDIPKVPNFPQVPDLSTENGLHHVREGWEGSTHCLERVEPQLSCGSIEHDLMCFADSEEPQLPRKKRILKPKSRKTKLSIQHEANIKEDITKLQPDRKTNAPSIEIVKIVRKRAAADLLVDDIEYLCTKKARLSLQDTDESVAKIGRITSIAGKSIFSDTASSRQVSGDFFTHRPLANVPKGYIGQFDGMVIKSNSIADFRCNLTDQDKFKSRAHYTFGDRLHANGVYTHTSIVFDPLCYSPDFTKENLPDNHPLLTCMGYATDMTIAATNTNFGSLRNHDEEILRRESHIECAHARLEGVAVGYYRYYQGHLSVEEYHDAGMCIC